MPINEAFTELTGLSSPKMNAMTVVAYTGAEISALSSTAVDGQVVYCTSTGSGYTRGNWYGWDSQLGGGSWISLNAIPANYAFFGSQEIANAGAVIDKRSPTRGQFMYGSSGTGAQVTDSYSIQSEHTILLETGTTTTGYAFISAGGPHFDFGQPALLKLKFETSGTAPTGQINKLGVAMDLAGTGPATRKMFGIEWCDGDSSFQIHSANGTTQSNFDTGITVTTNAIWQADIYFDPGNQILVNFDDGTTVTEKIKTSNVPSSGSSPEADLIFCSISNNAGNAANRDLELHAAYLVYGTADNWWT